MPRTPPYRRIAATYRDRILAGDLEAGETLPSRRDMCERHRAARATIDKVMDLLIGEGLVVQQRLKPAKVASRGRYGTCTEDRAAAKRATGRALGKKETSRILDTGLITCPEEIAAHLLVEPGEQVLHRKRVTSINKAPAAVSESFYTQETAELAPELAEPHSIPSGSRELAAERMGSEQDSVVQTVTSRLATDLERELLEMDRPWSIVTQVLRVVFLADGRVVEVAVKVTPGESPVTFRSRLQ